MIDEIARLKLEIAAAQDRVARLHGALDAIIKDLQMRGEMNRWQNDGELVVDVGQGVYSRALEALTDTGTEVKHD